MLHEQTKSQTNRNRLYRAKDFEIEALARHNMELISEQVATKFRIMKFRMKISFMAFQKNQTILEMFMKTIYDVYFQRKKQGLIQCPWPPIEKNVVKMVLLSIFNHVDEEPEPLTKPDDSKEGV